MEYWDLALEWLEYTPFGVRFSNALRLWFGDHLGLWPWQCLHAGSDLPAFDGGCSRQVEPFQNSNRRGSTGLWTWWEFWYLESEYPFNVPCIFLLDLVHLFWHFQSWMSQVDLLKASTGCSAAGVFTAVTWAPSTASSVSWRGNQWSCRNLHLFLIFSRCECVVNGSWSWWLPLLFPLSKFFLYHKESKHFLKLGLQTLVLSLPLYMIDISVYVDEQVLQTDIVT